MKLYVVRHGETDWNVQHRVQGKADIDLNLNGIEQAENTAKNIDLSKIDIVIASPLRRALQTAKTIVNRDSAEIMRDDRISERDFGEFEGLHKQDFDFDGYWSYNKNYTYERAENIHEFFDRIYGFLDDIKQEYKDKNILLVTHAGVCLPIYCYFNGIPENDNLLEFVPKNCEVVEYNTDIMEQQSYL